MLIENPKNILVIQLGDIGDVVLSFPCIRALKETYPAADIIVAVRDKAGSLIDLCQWAAGVITVRKEKRSIWQQVLYQKRFFCNLRRFRFDLAVDLRTDTRGAIMALLSGAPARLAFFANDGELWRNRVFTHLVTPQYDINQHIIDYHLGLLQPYGITPAHAEPQISIAAARQEAVTTLLQRHKIPVDRSLIALQPFSLWRYKEWTPEKFIELIAWLRGNYDFPILVTGGPAERQRAVDLCRKAGPGVFCLAGKTDLGMYAALLHRCRLLISVDSAGPHIAAATGTPTLTIYGPASPKTWAPRGDRHLVVQKDFPCVPCSRTGCQGSMVSRCIEELTVAEVSRAAQKLLTEVGYD